MSNSIQSHANTFQNQLDRPPAAANVEDSAPLLFPLPAASILIIGGGGHLGESRLQPALRKLPPGIADCLETFERAASQVQSA